MELVERRFEELGWLRHRMFSCDLGGESNPHALVLRFSGVYGVGSAGNGNADLMRVVTRAALDAWHSHAVVFDFRELSYEWGDAILTVFGMGLTRTGVEDLPCAMIVSERCRSGFATWGRIVPPMFDDLASAVASVAGPACARLDRLFEELDLNEC